MSKYEIVRHKQPIVQHNQLHIFAALYQTSNAQRMADIICQQSDVEQNHLIRHTKQQIKNKYRIFFFLRIIKEK